MFPPPKRHEGRGFFQNVLARLLEIRISRKYVNVIVGGMMLVASLLLFIFASKIAKSLSTFIADEIQSMLKTTNKKNYNKKIN
jgi:hypothetical protein